MKIRLILMLGGLLTIMACQKEEKDTTYLIAQDQIGKLTKGVKINQLDSIFKGDSVVNKNNTRRFSSSNEIVVYEKGGKELLRMQPTRSFDSTSTIASVEIIDTLYKTERGLGRGSEFKLVKEHYTINRIENTLGTAMVFIDELGIYFDIDKRDILEPTGMGVKIKSSQIKDKAKIKHIWMDWE